MNTQNRNHILADIEQAIKYANKQQKSKALIICNNYLNKLPDDAEVNAMFAYLCHTLNEVNLSISHYSKAVEIEPKNSEYLAKLGEELLINSQFQQADNILRKALEISPDSWPLLANLGATNSALANYDDAILFLNRSLSINPRSPKSYENLAICMLKTARYQEAIKYARKSIKLDPKNPASYNVLGFALTDTGNLSEAISNLEKAISIDRFHAASYVNLTRAKKFTNKDMPLIKSVEKILEKSMPAIDRSHFYFALAKMYDDCKIWDKAFFYCKQGNVLARPHFTENPIPKGYTKSLSKVFNKNLFDEIRPIGNQSNIPVFIVGMPRSGTSLLEQIISSHPDAAGAGELMKITSIANSISPIIMFKQYKADWDKTINEASINKLSTEYLDVLLENRDNALRVTDKLPENYLHLGLIKVLFPNAKIIHISRSPLDTCISCYFQRFADNNLSWSYDPIWIANRFHAYRNIMEFWKNALPADSIYDIRYEDLVDNPEPNIRSIIDYCDLTWDESCLNFHQSDNVVKTASVAQVRNPIYTSSKQRWARYGDNVRDIAVEIGEYLDDDDLERLKDFGIKIKTKRWWNYFSQK
jgi:tetratricopeptide (TPR) repeat protein